MARVERLAELTQALHAKSKAAGSDVSVVVGYTAAYAVYVHENMEAQHPRGGQAKFLETPARRLSNVLRDIVLKAVQSGASLGKGLLLAGLRLQRESQLLCPVDTGNLRASAFTRIES